MKIAIGCDHAGFSYKTQLMPYLAQLGYDVVDFGCASVESVDYPDYAKAVAMAVASGEAERGILICSSGVGMSICANKVRGIRCALCSEPVSARLCREHNNSNVLALGANMVGMHMAKEIIAVWLQTEALQEARHQRRVQKMMDIETI